MPNVAANVRMGDASRACAAEGEGVPNSASKGPEWARFMAELHADVPDEIRNLLKELNLNRSRRLDLFRVKKKISISCRHSTPNFAG